MEHDGSEDVREGRHEMQQQTLWADRIPGAPYPFPIADLAMLPDDGYTYEIVEGELIRMPASGVKAARVASRLHIALGVYVKTHGLGEVLGADGTYDLTRPGDPTDTALVPDVSFVLAGRLPAMDAPDADKYARLPPDLAAEVASPSQYRPEIATKAKLYLDRGVRLVWVLWPNRQEVDIWRASSPNASAMTLTLADSLDGLDVIPGFTLPLTDLFL